MGEYFSCWVKGNSWEDSWKHLKKTLENIRDKVSSNLFFGNINTISSKFDFTDGPILPTKRKLQDYEQIFCERGKFKRGQSITPDIPKEHFWGIYFSLLYHLWRKKYKRWKSTIVWRLLIHRMVMKQQVKNEQIKGKQVCV